MKLRRNRKLISILITLSMLMVLLVPLATPASAASTYSMTTVNKVKAGTTTNNIGSLVINMDPATASTMTVGKYVYLDLPSNPTGYKLAVTGGLAAISYTGMNAGVGYVTATQVSTTEIQLTANATFVPNIVATASNIQIIVPLTVDIPGGVSGEVKLSVNCPGSQPFAPSGTVTIAKVGGSSATIASESVENIGSGGGNIGVIDIKEDTSGSLADSGGTAALKLKLPVGVTWKNVPTVTTMWGNVSIPAANMDITGDSGRTLAIKVPAANQSTSGSFIKLTGSVTIDESTAKTGDVTIAVSGATSVDNSTLTVAKYGDYSVTAKALSAPNITAGKVASDVGKIELDESIGGSMVKSRTVTLTLPDGVKWSQAPNKDTNLSDDQGLAFDAPTMVGTDGKMLKLTVGTASGSNPAKYVLKDFQVTPAVDFSGDLKVTVGGSQGLTGDLTIAKVVGSATMAASAKTDVKIGLPDQPIGDITITEAAAGAFDSKVTASKQNADGTVVSDTTASGNAQLQVKAPAGVTFSGTPTVEVTDGDLQLDSSSVKTDTDSTNAGILYVTIKGTSSKASTLKISGIKVTVDRTVPEGGLTFKVKGNAVNETLTVAASDSIFPGRTTAGKAVVANVVTPAPGTTKAKAVFKIGDTKFTLNGAEQTMDAAPYLKNDRTYLPLRFVAKAVGVPDSNIIWNASEQTVVLIKDGSVVKLTIGSTIMTINGTPITMDVAPEIVDPGRTMLPVRWVGQALGCAINWDNATQTVTVN